MDEIGQGRVSDWGVKHPMDNIRILVVDDDEKIIKFLRVNLSEEGWRILTAKDGDEALQMVGNYLPDIVILDIMMPKVDGFEVCCQLRQWSQVPIIALSARGDMPDKVKCLNLGADDYITKPFSIDELIARVKAMLRRNKIDDSVPQKSPFICDNIKIDFVKRRVFLADNEVSLTPTEYRLLQELVINAGKNLTYTYLLRKIWGPEYSAEREYLHVYIGHLRTKLESDPKKPEYIISVPRVGYRFQK